MVLTVPLTFLTRDAGRTCCSACDFNDLLSFEDMFGGVCKEHCLSTVCNKLWVYLHASREGMLATG